MHWGLTTFEKKRIEMIALDHPYFDTHAPLLTKKEISAIVREGSHKNGYQVIADIMAELGITYVPAKRKKRSFREALRDMSFVPSFRRTVTLGVFCLLLALFMTFTAPGRAFAEEVYSIIINLMDGMINARNNIPSESHKDSEFTMLPREPNTSQELSFYIDYPVIVTKDRIIAFDLEAESAEVLITVCQYQDSEGRDYIVSQEFYSSNVYWGVGADAQQSSIEVNTPSGIRFIINRSEDSTVYAMGFLDSCLITVAGNGLSEEELLSIIHRIEIIE